jgi:hypothetical protein
MKRVVKLAVVGIALWFEFLLITCLYDPYPHGQILDVPYRQKERLAAIQVYRLNPSPAAKATRDEELRRMRGYVGWMTILRLGFLVAVNGIGIYYFVGYGEKKATA